MSNPSISVRRHIRETPRPAEEPTSTLVLTSHTSHYVDIRIFTARNAGEPELPNEGGPMERLEWAFAGISHITPSTPKSGSMNLYRSVWTHWVDSKTDTPKPDEGDMYPQPNGDTLEKGSSRDLATGTVTEYEELWADVPVEKTGRDEKRVSVVLQLQDDARKARGMVVRVGGWCQGLLKIGDETTLERWKWVPGQSEMGDKAATTGVRGETPASVHGSSSEGHGETASNSDHSGNWKRVVRLGIRFLPCAVTFDPELAKVGSVVEAGDASWKVVENYQW